MTDNMTYSLSIFLMDIYCTFVEALSCGGPVMFSGRPPGGYIVNIDIVIIYANIIHILICDTIYGNVFDYISVSSLMLIMYGLTPISYTLYFRLYQ